MPPPNLIQQQPPPHTIQTQQQNIIFQTAPASQPAQIPLQQLQLPPPPPPPQHGSNNLTESPQLALVQVKDEHGSPEPSDSQSRQPGDEQRLDSVEPKPEPHEMGAVTMQPPKTITMVPPPIQFTSSPILSVPPPNACVQHIVGNALIQTTAQPTGQTILVNAQPPYATQAFPIAQNVQNIQLAQQVR